MPFTFFTTRGMLEDSGYESVGPKKAEFEFERFVMNGKTYSYLKPDCFYRINNNRILNGLDFCKKDISAKFLFVNRFSKILSEKKPKKVRFLRGTIFETFNLILNFYENGIINKRDLNFLLSKFSKSNFHTKQKFL